MLMVIFGAGASYDAVPTRRPHDYPGMTERMPLADELFDDRPAFAGRMRWFPKCLDIVPRLHKIASPNTVEAALEALRAEADTYPERHRQLAAVRFYLQSIIWDTEDRWQGIAQGMTNYRTLVDQIMCAHTGDQICFVTFNYDRMLESALGNWGLKFDHLSNYVNHEKFKVIKLHGSINWVKDIDEIETCVPDFNYTRGGWQEQANALIARADCLKISHQHRMITAYPAGLVDTMPAFPAIAIPVQNKDEFECPPAHIESLRSFVRSHVTKILVVGWRGLEFPFRRLLSEELRPRGSTRVPIMVVAPPPGAAQTVENLQAAELYGPFTVFDRGFTDFIRNPAAGNEFLTVGP